MLHSRKKQEKQEKNPHNPTIHWQKLIMVVNVIIIDYI